MCSSDLRALPDDGFAVLDADSPFFNFCVSQLRAGCVSISLSDSPTSTWRGSLNDNELRIEGVDATFVAPLAGCHNARNLFMAAALANRLGLAWEDMNAALEKLHVPGMRGQSFELRGRRVINDAYNANPMSMRCAFETFAQQTRDWQGRRIVVLGDMRELGETSEALHRALGEFIARHALKLDVLVVVGAMGEWIADAFQNAGGAAKVLRFADAPTAAQTVWEWTREGDVVLLKASRGIGLERIFEG